ncbi:TD and POZ domain-containing protein 3 [Trichonephila clavata]|uniref:TD and POZ domain-containing protein 3 n=1 Tax=Trichonephila clavata TaxID=2740835 RepID=A0A8X6KYS8_TRICU|nr:TD and POZ domain-containing protein 3 [Trichonephila clavata]
MDLLGKKDLFLKDDILSLYCECIFPTIISFEEIISTKFEVIIPLSVPKVNIIGKQSDKVRSLKEDFKTLYTDGTLSDIKLCTKTESFPVHAAILCARSPVFKDMFSDDIKEKFKGSVDIIDLDNNTIRRMLLYMYTDRLEDLQWESALQLYEAAGKYEILSLREKCSAFMEDHLSTTNACDALVLADRHQDSIFKEAVQNYIIYHDRWTFCSKEWEILLENHSKLAAETMHKVWKK